MGHDKEQEDEMMSAANSVDMNNVRKTFIKFSKLCEMNVSHSVSEMLAGLLNDDVINIIGLQTRHSWDTPLQSAAIEGLHDFLFLKTNTPVRVEVKGYDCFTIEYEGIKFVLCEFHPSIYYVLFQRQFEMDVHQIIDQHIF